MRVTLIHNPDAGEGRPTQDELVGLLRRNGYDAKYVSAEEPNWTHALQDPGELIVAAGEDGTVAQVAKAVAGRGMPIALLPLGTANNIATSLGAWTDPNVQVARWKAARPRAFDFGIRVGRDGRESPFLESVGCGVFAEVTARGRAGARPRRPRHRVALGSNERRARDVPRRAARGATAAGVSLDGVDHSGEYLLVEAMNIACIGPGLRLAPDADRATAALTWSRWARRITRPSRSCSAGASPRPRSWSVARAR